MRVTNKNDVIVAHKVSLGYHQRILIENINLHIHQGEFIGILGPNGSGKSTFLCSLLGLIQPLSGKLSIFDQKPQKGNVTIGYMPQIRKYTLPTYLTSRALIEACDQGTYYGIPLLSQAKKMRIQKLLELVNAEHYADRPFSDLSGGEKQRIYLAQALLGDPQILLLDEPLANLDPKIQKKFIELLKQIQSNLNMTILFTAHDPNPLLTAMDRVLYFAQGKTAIGTVTEIITTDTLSALYGVPVEVLQFKDRLLVIGDHFAEEGHHHD